MDSTISLDWNEGGKTLAEMLCYCVKLEFHESDGLPFRCCTSCKDDLIVAFKLIVRCQQSDEKFRVQLLEAVSALRETSSLSAIAEHIETTVEFEYNDPFKEESSESSSDEKNKTRKDNNLTHDDNEFNSKDDEETQIDKKGDKAVETERKRRKYVKRKVASIPKRCCKCKTRFENEEQAEDHVKVHLDSKQTDPQKISSRPYECNACFKRYTNRRALQFHQRERYIDKPYECDECEHDFISEDLLIDHKELHTKDADERKKLMPKCCACYEQFESEASLEAHCKEIHLPESQSIDNAPQDNDFVCPTCYRRYKTRRSLLNHKLKPYRTKQYQCSQCGRIFRDKCALSDHERCHQGERPFVCPVCSKTFAIKDSFRKHVKSHAIEDDHFKCETCGKGFKTKGNLKDHYITHASDYRPLGCSLCPATFARKSCLKSHMRMHTGEKPFRCLLCDASYAFSSDLKRHVMAHTGIKPYICNVCGRGYPRQDYLRKHLASHSSGNAPNS
ncbi:gastrula zinc finger protein XlCGF46.1-like isoform X2 [Armigeres subalbatus]